MTDNLTKNINEIKEYYNKYIVKTAEIHNFANDKGYNVSEIMSHLKDAKISHGTYNLNLFLQKYETVEKMENNLNVVDNNSYLPEVDVLYAKTDFYNDLETILKSGMFYPVVVSGPTGDGKTLTCEQVAANLRQKIVRVNITVETDEDSLMGNYRLIDGNTVYVEGPVITAMKNGHILLLDEFDLGHPARMMCLQSVLEGKGYHIKRDNRWIKPKEGFMIIATSNTKGAGDDGTDYIGTSAQNAAFLDRFKVIFETDYPSKKIETEILTKIFKKYNIKNKNNLIKSLVETADLIRKTKKDTNEIEHVLSTRRLVDIASGIAIWGDIKKSFAMCMTRFDERHQKAFKNTFFSIYVDDEESKNMKEEESKTLDDEKKKMEEAFKNLQPF